MKSKTGSLLVKIAAIINIVIAGLVIFGGILSLIGITLYTKFPINLSIVIFIIAILISIFGYLLLDASKKMQNSKTVKNGSIWAIVLGVLTISSIAGILALIGGIIGLIDADKKK